MEQARRIDPAGIVIAALLLVLAAVIYWDTTTLQIASTYGVGPKAMPFVVASMLVLLSAGNLLSALRGGATEREPSDSRAILLILGGLAVLTACVGFGLGFIPAVAVLFAATAAAFGRRAILIDLVIGFVLGVVIFVVFDKLLTLSLPAGPLERLF